MLTFNHVLSAAGITPGDVRLARHRPRSPSQVRLARDLAFQRDIGFQRYQERQGDPAVIGQLRNGRYVAGFIAEPGTGLTVFVGVWERTGERTKLVGDPISPASGGPARPGIVEFVTDRIDKFDQLIGKLVIDWGEGHRAWVQRADRQDKRIIELRKEVSDPAFPGYLGVRIVLAEVDGIYAAWAEPLRHARGIYLLVHRDSGQQYVGSAYGADGFLGRWRAYSDGHGGNVAMKELKAPAEAFDATILEVASSAASTEDVFARENLWKEKLGTRVKGLNRN